jgi:hypothetical protein
MTVYFNLLDFLLNKLFQDTINLFNKFDLIITLVE